jgi:hypothetical protein
MKIDLVIDASFPPSQPAGEARHPALERLIARGDAFMLEATDLPSCLAALFALPHGAPLPMAALSLLGDGIDPGSDDWLRLDPVHLRADRARLLLMPLPPGDITPAEADAMHDALAPLLAPAGHELVRGDPQRWYLRFGYTLDLRTEPPPRTAGTLDQEQLPQGHDGAPVRRLVTEAQMLLYALPMNEAREAQGRLSVNAVWPWGNGRLVALGPSRYSHACSDDPIVRGIARAAGAEAAPLPPDAERLVATLPAASTLLAVCRAADGSLAEVVQHWSAPLASLLRRGHIEELRLVLIGANRLLARRVSRNHLRRFWRRSRRLRDA